MSPGIDSPILAVRGSSEAASAETSTGADLARALAKLLSDAVQLFLADLAGLDAPSQLFSLALPKLANLIRWLRMGLYGYRHGQRFIIGLGPSHTQTCDEGQAQADSPDRGND